MSYPSTPDAIRFTHRGRTYEVRAEQDVTADRDRYSKAWHRSYGPAYTVDQRYGVLVTTKADGTDGRRRRTPLSSFRGDWARRTVAEVLPGAVDSYDAVMEPRKEAAKASAPARLRRKDLVAAGACDEGVTGVIRCINRCYYVCEADATLSASAASWTIKAVLAALAAYRNEPEYMMDDLGDAERITRLAGYDAVADALGEINAARRAFLEEMTQELFGLNQYA